MDNIELSYLYRDGGNNKRFGSAIFSNPDMLPLVEIDFAIKECLDGPFPDVYWLHPEEYGLPTLYFEDGSWDRDMDYECHEYEGVALTELPITDDRGIQGLITAIRLKTNKEKSLH